MAILLAGGAFLIHHVPPSLPVLTLQVSKSIPDSQDSPSRPWGQGWSPSHPTPTTTIINANEPQQIEIWITEGRTPHCPGVGNSGGPSKAKPSII